MTNTQTEEKLNYWVNKVKLAEGEYKKLCLRQIKSCLLLKEQTEQEKEKWTKKK